MEIDISKDYAVIDLETTGKNVPDGKIIEIAIVKIKQCKIIDYFHSLINPCTKLNWYVSKLTGIKSYMLKNAPTFKELAPEIVSFLGNSIIVAHNANFDYPFLKCELERAIDGFTFQNEKLCTVMLARKRFPELGKYNLDFIMQNFNINNPDRHRAYGDAMATAEFFLKFLIK